MKDISEKEIEEFVSLISEQKDTTPVGKYVKDMTSGKFYEYCALGYQANSYKDSGKMSPKELYYKNADGRDEGLAELDENSTEDFERWYHDRERWGGHPWEVCRGGNSTHIGLYIQESEQGYYLRLAGKAWTRSIETIKFYIALRKNGVAVYLDNAKGITDRLLGRDKIGIIPRGVYPVYCESWFPEDDILDFMNLPYEKEQEVAKCTVWMKEDEQFLKEKYKIDITS